MGPEAKLQQKILKWLRSRPGSFTRKWAQGPYSGAGMPDIHHLEGGVPWYIEVKAPGCKPTPLQVRCMKDLEAAGARVLVAWSLDDVKEAFAR